MDLFFDANDATAVSELRAELSAFFARHALDGSDLSGAELAVSELLANAVRHAPGPAWLHIDWSEQRPRVEIHDLGPGFELDPRLPELAGAARRAGGSRVSAVMPVERAVAASYDPPRRTRGALPAAGQAAADGTFGREPFLLALVVELAHAVEAREGPGAAQAAVAQVGANVGGRMEDEYRRARELVGELTHGQIADLYVRLKAAIGGDFYVIEASDERIILGNRRCPFGEVVRRAPGLCRMTSSVFGGIAARNTGGASVVLEERIAIGDPECRVVVWLGAHKHGQLEFAHDYVGDAGSAEDRPASA
jgi:predicted ArsR family transcriptional regulator